MSTTTDTRAVLALAKQAGMRGHNCETCPVLADLRAEVAELRKRVRLIRKTFYAAKTVARYGTTNLGALAGLTKLLDLRVGLPKARRKP